MNAKQKIHSTKLAIWNEHFKEQASGDLSVKDYCHQNNLSLYAFYYWKRIAKEDYVDSILPDIVPLSQSSSLVSQVPDSPSRETIQSVYSESRNLYNSLNSNHTHISINDISIDIGPSASDELILSIIKAVRHA